MKSALKKSTAKPKQNNYYQSQYYKKMLNKNIYSNWIKEKIAQQQTNDPNSINNNLNKSNIGDNKTKRSVNMNNLVSNRKKTNIHSSFDSKRMEKRSDALYRKYTKIGGNKNSAFETFNWMKNKKNNKKNLSKSMSNYNFSKEKDLNKSSLVGTKSKNNLKRNFSLAMGLDNNQDYDSKNNYKNRAVNNNYRFIINNNYYNKNNNKNMNHLASESLQFFIGKEDQLKKGGHRNISAPKNINVKNSSNLEILRLEKKIERIQGKINRLNSTKKQFAEDSKMENLDGLDFNEDDLKNMNGDIYDIINGIENSLDNKKNLRDDEIRKMAETMGGRLYHTSNYKDFAENENDYKNIINVLNNMKNNDKNKVMDILKEKADDENKVKQFNKLKNEIVKNDGLKNFVRNIINQQKKEEKKLDNVAEDILEELDSECTIELTGDENEDKKVEKVEVVINMLKDRDENEQNKILEKLKLKSKNSGKNEKVRKMFPSLKAILKMKNYAKSIKNKLRRSKNPGAENEKNKDDDIEDLENIKIRKILEGFQKDLYDEEDIPLTRKEMKQSEIDNNEKIKKISKIIDSMNKKDKEQVMNTLKIKADDEYKKSQYDKLVKILNNINNVKSFFVKYIKNDGNNKKIDNKKDLSKNEIDNIINDLIKDLFNNTEDKEISDENIKKSAKILNRLNKTQQKLIFTNLQSKANSNKKAEILQKLEIELKGLSKLNIFAKAFNLKNSTIINIKNKKEKIDEVESNVELNDNEIISLVQAIIDNLFNKSKKGKNDADIYVSELDKYLLKTEKEKNLENTAVVLKSLKRKDSQKISKILNYILKSDEEIKALKELNKKLGINNDNINDKNMKNILNIIDDFNNDDEAQQLKDDKLVELAQKLATDLMKDYSKEEKNKKIDSLNRAANSIILLNKKDQEKILDTLNDFAINEKQKEMMEKLNKLVENLNYMKFYLYSLDEKIIEKNAQKDLGKKDFNNLKTSVMHQIFEEDEFNLNLTNNSDENIDNITKVINNLSNNNRTKILEDIKEKAKEYENNENVKKTIEKLNQNLKKCKVTNLFSNLIDLKTKKEEKKNLTDNEIQQLVDKINGALFVDDKKSNNKNNNYTEQLLLNKNKERKIQKFVSSINNFSEESQKKTLNLLSKSGFRNKNKDDYNKLKNSIMSSRTSNNKFNNKANLAASTLYWQNSLGRLELNVVELNILIDTFFKDLFNEEIEDEEIKEDNLNLIANLIKELHIENQNKVMEIIENKPETKNKSELIENLRERILRLRLLKDELEEKDDNSLLDKTEETEENKYDDFDDIIEEVDDSDETLTVEISVEEDIDKKDLDEICKVFKAEVVKDKNEEEKEKEKKKKRNLNKSVNFLANSIVRLDKSGQKKITDKLEKNAKNEFEKEQLKLLMERVKELNSFKKISKEIQQREKEQMKNVEKEIKDIENLNENSIKNLNKENLEKLEKEIIDNLFNQGNIKFDKNNVIKKYLLKAQNGIKLKIIAEKLNALSKEDKKNILDKIQNLANDNEKKSQYNRLIKLTDDLLKMKEINEKIQIKKNKSNEGLPKQKLVHFAENCEKTLFGKKSDSGDVNNKDIVKEVANKIINLNDNNKDFILNNLKEKSNDEEKNNQVNKVVNMINKKSNLKKFKNKVKEKMINKEELEKIENEKKYGIYIISNDEKDNSKMILIKKPTELLNEDKLNEIQSAFIENLEKINEEEKQDNISNIDKYLKEKDNEKKCEEIIDVINSLVLSDKNKILKNIKNNFDKPKNNNLFIKFMKMLKKKERIFDNEKRKRQEEVLDKIGEEENKDNNEDIF